MHEVRRSLSLKGAEGEEVSPLQLEARLREIDRQLAIGAIKRQGLTWIVAPGLVGMHALFFVRLLDIGLTPRIGFAFVLTALLLVSVIVMGFRHLDSQEAELDTAKGYLSGILELKLAPAGEDPDVPERAT